MKIKNTITDCLRIKWDIKKVWSVDYDSSENFKEKEEGIEGKCSVFAIQSLHKWLAKILGSWVLDFCVWILYSNTY